jgi:alkylation response protein AidB-like acyl-CoA dehydrogenase
MTDWTGRLTLEQDPGAYLELAERLDEPVADSLLDARERELRQIARDVAARELVPRAAAVDRTHTFAHDGYQALVAAGLGGLLFEERWGGTGDSHVAYAAVIEEVAAGCAATSLVFMTQMHAAYPIVLAGSEELQARTVPRLVSGQAYGSLAITEPDAGSDVSAIRTTATPTDDGYELSGAKTFITTGDRADIIVCFASVDRSRGRDAVTALVVEGDRAGLTTGQPLLKAGMHGSSTAELFFDRVLVPAANRLGAEGSAWSVVMGSVVKSRISAAAQGVGIARAAYGRTLAALARLHGTQVPADVIARLAAVRGRILRGCLLLRSVARRVDIAGTATTGEIGMMKQTCTELGFTVALECADLLGGYGDLAAIGVERAVRDAAVTQIYDGTNDIQRLLIGREIAGVVRGMAPPHPSPGGEQ